MYELFHDFIGQIPTLTNGFSFINGLYFLCFCLIALIFFDIIVGLIKFVLRGIFKFS